VRFFNQSFFESLALRTLGRAASRQDTSQDLKSELSRVQQIVGTNAAAVGTNILLGAALRLVSKGVGIFFSKDFRGLSSSRAALGVLACSCTSWPPSGTPFVNLVQNGMTTQSLLYSYLWYGVDIQFRIFGEKCRLCKECS
jgi:hypothetical protein